MRRALRGPLVSMPIGLLLLVLAGCAGSSPRLKNQVAQLEKQYNDVLAQKNTLQTRVNTLDTAHQGQSVLLAQAQQMKSVLETTLAETRGQLSDVNAQLADIRQEKQSADSRVQALTASLQRRGGVTITPNSSALRSMPSINLPEVVVRRDEDVIRVELPGSRLFESGSARPLPGAATLVAEAAAELAGRYPNQMIGIEGHTDSDPVSNRGWTSNHQLSVLRAQAVFDLLVSRTQLKPSQLFVVGRGANHPVASNGTPEGRRRNRRVELVVFPQTVN